MQDDSIAESRLLLHSSWGKLQVCVATAKSEGTSVRTNEDLFDAISQVAELLQKSFITYWKSVYYACGNVVLLLQLKCAGGYKLVHA